MQWRTKTPTPCQPAALYLKKHRKLRMRHGSPWCCYVRHGQILRNTPKRDHQGGRLVNLLFWGLEMWWEKPGEEICPGSEILWPLTVLWLKTKKRWLSRQGTFESKDSAGLWIKWSSFGILQMQVHNSTYIYIANQMRIIGIVSEIQRLNPVYLHAFHCEFAIFSFEEKPWMLLMLGGSGAGKGTFLRATCLNFRYLFFDDIFVWVKSICLCKRLQFTSILSWFHGMWWFPCDDLKHFE